VVLLCAVVLLATRDWMTFVLVFGLGVVCALLVLFTWSWLVALAAYLMTWILTSDGVVGTLGGYLLPPLRSRTRPDDDCQMLADTTGIPRLVWVLGLLALGGWCTWLVVVQLVVTRLRP
jgi:hypothetical protein